MELVKTGYQRTNPKRLKFVEEYFKTGGNATEAFLKTGYRAKNRNNAAKQANQLMRNNEVRVLIEWELSKQRDKIRSLVPKAITTLEEIIDNKEIRESVRIDASKEILDRAGVQPLPPQKPDSSFNIQINFVDVGKNPKPVSSTSIKPIRVTE